MTKNFPRSEFTRLYGNDACELDRQGTRWEKLLDEFIKKFPGVQPVYFSAPGRTEICGNHTDHNHGRVLAASVNLDSIGIASRTADGTITILSQGFPQPFVVAAAERAPQNGESGTTTALIRGITSRFQQMGYRSGGFQACIASDVLIGSGLSSSASVEVLVGTILNTFFNDGRIDPLTIGRIGQFSENAYFGKPCGLMDQITCAVGGIVAIDFKDPEQPVYEKIEFDFSAGGYDLLVIDTGGDHARLTEEYASIPREMKAVAKLFGKETCRDITPDQLFDDRKRVRSLAGDRAFLRAMHFIAENERVDLQLRALRANDLTGFLQLVRESGSSSFRWLQNCYSTRDVAEQGISVALALTERFLGAIGGGACRVHGGGFAGTIQVFLPREHTGEYIRIMNGTFSDGCVKRLHIRQTGAISFIG